MRDLLSHEGRSERTHGSYLLRFSNAGPRQHVRFMDQLPFFVRPLWHTLRATVNTPEQPPEEIWGLDVMRRLELTFTSSDGQRLPTELFLTVDVPRGGVVSLFLDVTKAFIQLREFSYACEKGFDVGSAAWLEAEIHEDERSASPGPGVGPLWVDELLKPQALLASFGRPASQSGWRLRLTGGLLVLVPMPDFSMPFNVIALSSTAVTFFFGSIFRLTAAGRVPHWVLKKEQEIRRPWTFWAQRLTVAVVVGGLYALSAMEASQLKELRDTLPSSASPVVDFLESMKDSLEKVAR